MKCQGGLFMFRVAHYGCLVTCFTSLQLGLLLALVVTTSTLDIKAPHRATQGRRKGKEISVSVVENTSCLKVFINLVLYGNLDIFLYFCAFCLMCE